MMLPKKSRMGFLAMTGQDLHLLDDTQSFMVVSHPPIPFDPQGLVALKYLSVGAAQHLDWRAETDAVELLHRVV